MEHLGEKLKLFRKGKGWTQAEMADYLSIGHRTYQDIEKNGIVKKANDLARIEEMTSINTQEIASGSTPSSDYVTRRRVQKTQVRTFMAPLVPVKARAGYVSSYDQTDFLNTLDQYALPPGVNPSGAIWRWFEVDGDSMEQTLMAGDYILCSMVPHVDWNQIRNFYVYVIVTSERVLVKRIYRKTETRWVLISDNEEMYDQEYIQVSDIKELWVFRRKLENTARPPKRFEIKI